jgi:c-di-GMP-binding flagellar brake protein YcgR
MVRSKGGDPSATGLLTKSPAEIMRVLVALRDRREPISARAEDGAPAFLSHLLWIDPEMQFIVVGLSGHPAADAALLARSRCVFNCALAAWQVEFVAAEPRLFRHGAQDAIRLRYPELMSGHQRRAVERVTPVRNLPLQCLADAGGLMAFNAQVIDISPAGLAVLLYHSGITLEPGTLLVGCVIEHPALGQVSVDMEVRYSEPVRLKDGRHAQRAGCRFVAPTESLKALVRRVTGQALSEDG